MRDTSAGALAEEGISLMEVVISMLILAVLALCLLPLLILGARQSSANVTTEAGTQLVDQQLDTAQAKNSVCATIAALAGTYSTTDSRGTALTRTTTASACPSTYPGTMTVTVAVTKTAGVAVASASTLIYVNAAS
jgi:Tfp pilus assembly protein PilV